MSSSNPNVLYVGSGEGLQRPDLSVGNGICKSTDAAKRWMHMGLANIQQVGGLAIDPENENRVFVAALGHPYGPNGEYGVYRTTDGGKTWDRVLYKDENTAAAMWAASGLPGKMENGTAVKAGYTNLLMEVIYGIK